MSAEKDEFTDAVRRKILERPWVAETGYADAGTTILSFQSKSHPHHHVWIDTDLGGLFKIDLEDWTYEGSWDNSVAHLTVDHSDSCPEIVAAWLSGGSVETCKGLGGRVIDIK